MRPISIPARSTGRTHLTDDGPGLIAASGLDVVVEATGDPRVGTRHALAAIEHGRHLVMVNVEADVLVGPVLAARARQAGLVYSLAYGDQPALICEMVDWARACGFAVVCAGKGTRYLPHFHQSTPATVWEHFGITPAAADAAGMNPKMFNSFVDGTKSGIEMAAVANATGLEPQGRGLSFFPCGTHDLARVLQPESEGGQLEREGTVEVISDRERDGRHVHGDLRQGVYVTFRAPTDYAAACFAQYGVTTESERRDRRAVAPVPSDRPRTRRQHRVGGAAWRADRLPDGLPRRGNRHCQAQSRRRRVARWRGR